jgi:hypothetical protein
MRRRHLKFSILFLPAKCSSPVKSHSFGPGFRSSQTSSSTSSSTELPSRCRRLGIPIPRTRLSQTTRISPLSRRCRWLASALWHLARNPGRLSLRACMPSRSQSLSERWGHSLVLKADRHGCWRWQPRLSLLRPCQSFIQRPRSRSQVRYQRRWVRLESLTAVSVSSNPCRPFLFHEQQLTSLWRGRHRGHHCNLSDIDRADEWVSDAWVARLSRFNALWGHAAW